jgi:DNA-binding transcriptional MerR regulator
MGQYLRTSDISRAVGVHPNTVRLYEAWGFLPPIPRSESGYRLFNEGHLEQMRLARLAFADPYPGRRIRRSARKIVRVAATGDLNLAQNLAETHQELVRSELEQTGTAAAYLERWAAGQLPAKYSGPVVNRSGAAKLLDVTPETLRHWERNGLITVPRNRSNNYRQYGPAEIDRLRVIRLLSRAGYSTMAILRMIRQLDQGRRDNLGQVLDTPDPEEDLLYASDRWLSTLIIYEKRTEEMLAQLEKMME